MSLPSSMDKPNWTVLCNVVSKESDKWIGTSWEFFTREQDAQDCYDRHRKAGDCPTMRTFYEACDRKHMAVGHLPGYVTF